MEKFVMQEEFTLAELCNHFVVGTIVIAPAEQFTNVIAVSSTVVISYNYLFS
jgi:hypothetical protein